MQYMSTWILNIILALLKTDEDRGDFSRGDTPVKMFVAFLTLRRVNLRRFYP